LRSAVATITSKGQITIPIAIRRHLQADMHDKIEFIVNADGDVCIRPVRIPTIASLSGLHLRERRSVLRALELYETTTLDFTDTLIVAAMEQRGSTSLYSYDRHFDRLAGIHRLEP
jgi:AbrB family looped-hinge helix DNA binding protein